MLEQELKDIWKSSSQIERIKFDLSRLMIDLNTKMSGLEKAIRQRDRREIGACFIGIPLFTYLAYEVPFPIAKIGALLTVTHFVYLIFKFRRMQKKKRSADLSLSFREQLDHQKGDMQEQVTLLDSVLWWYILPPYITNIIMIFGMGNPAEYDWSPLLIDAVPVGLSHKLTLVIGLAIFYGLIVLMNKRVVKKTLKPTINEIDRVLLQLESEN